MKNPIKILLLAGILSTAFSKGQVKISPAFYGIPLWYTDYSYSPFYSGGNPDPLDQSVWTAFKETGAATVRVGGEQFCVDNPLVSPPRPALFPHTGTQGTLKPTPAGYVKIVDDIRAQGMEPMIQVPIELFIGLRSIEEQALEAAEIVRTVNHIHKRNVKYWIIGNEPEFANQLTPTANGVALVSKYIRAFATAMKDVDPDIKTIGFEHHETEEQFFKPWSGSLIHPEF